jgi:hypothetical protein
LVVLVVTNLYLQVVAGGSRLESARAQVETARAVYQQAVDRERTGVAARIDVVRAQVEMQAQQSAVRQRSRALTQDLRSKINPGEIEGLERNIATGARNDKILASKPVELFKQRLPLLTDRQAV